MWTVSLWSLLSFFLLESVVDLLMCVAWIGLDDKLAEEALKNRDLEKELGEVKGNLRNESNEHKALHVTVGVVCDDL